MTSQRVAVIIVCVFVILLASVSPVYVVNTFGVKYSPGKNTTIVGLVFTGDRENVEKASFIINNGFVPFSAFVVITFCTITLVVKLQNVTKWRQKSLVTVQADSISRRNQKAAKMVVMISILFIVCFVPLCVTFIAMSVEPEFSVDGKYRNSLTLVGGVGVFLECINSSVNIFIYYQMSSRYRAVFRQLFRIDNVKTA